MFGIEVNDRFHVNSRGVLTDVRLPLQEGDWMFFETKDSAEKYAKNHQDINFQNMKVEIVEFES